MNKKVNPFTRNPLHELLGDEKAHQVIFEFLDKLETLLTYHINEAGITEDIQFHSCVFSLLQQALAFQIWAIIENLDDMILMAHRSNNAIIDLITSNHNNMKEKHNAKNLNP